VATVPPTRLPASYVLPLRWTSPGPITGLSEYLARLVTLVDETIVVDASPREIFRVHADQLPGPVRHVRPALPPAQMARSPG